MKRLVGIELSHQKAPLSVREKITLTAEDTKTALKKLNEKVSEVFIIATCNRLAVYALTEDMSPLLDFFRQFGDLDAYLSLYDHEPSAIRHLFATASGLESQAIGEHEILGQIKKAYAQAQECGTLGPVSDEFIRRAIFVGKKVRKETAIGQYPVSLASVAYDVLRARFKDLSRSSVLVLGTGEMASLMLKIIGKKPLRRLVIASRTHSRAQSMAHIHGGEAIEMDRLMDVMADTDIVIGSTHTASYVITAEQMAELNDGRIRTLVDLGLPRNFDPDMKTQDEVKLFDLDDLKSMTEESMQKRQEEIPRAMDLVEEEVGEFLYWLNTRKVSPVISSYFDKLEQIRQEELKWALPKLGNLDENQQKIIETMLSRMTRRMSGKPIERLRQFSQDPDAEMKPIDTFKELFDL